MIFTVENINENILSLARRLGYIVKESSKDEVNCVRPLSDLNYPRFHLFIKRKENNKIIFNLHLDQKKPSYKGSHAHSGEYTGEVVIREAERIKMVVLSCQKIPHKSL